MSRVFVLMIAAFACLVVLAQGDIGGAGFGIGYATLCVLVFALVAVRVWGERRG